MTLPRITLVTPSYNQGEFLEETILSVLDQNYADLEYFVVDGGSTDRSRKIIDRYASRLSWWTQEPDTGQVAAINRGFARATGELLGWLNSDDTLLPGALQKVAEAFVEHPDALLVYGDAELIDATGAPLGPLLARPFDLVEMVRTCQNHVVQPGSLFRRRAIEIAPLNEQGYYYFDFEFAIAVGLAGEVVKLDGSLATYRIHDAAKSVSAPVRKAEDHLRVYDEIFANPALTPQLKAVERESRARSFLVAAEYFYAGLAMGRARRALLRAFSVDHGLITPANLALFARMLLPARIVRELRTMRG